MPARNANVTDGLDRFVSAKAQSVRYENASEVVRAAFAYFGREEQEHEAKVAAIRRAIDKRDCSGVADGVPFLRIRQALKLPNKKC